VGGRQIHIAVVLIFRSTYVIVITQTAMPLVHQSSAFTQQTLAKLNALVDTVDFSVIRECLPNVPAGNPSMPDAAGQSVVVSESFVPSRTNCEP
jgi:hypothetical protein